MFIKMATSGRSFIQASDILYEFSCSPCSENKKNSEAIYRCVECKTFLCAKCRDGHNQFVKGHKVVDVGAKDIGGSLIHWKGYKCEEHPDKMIEMYCKAHDEVYCPVCILQHRSCTGVEYVPNVAKILLENQDKECVEKELKQQCVDLQKLKRDRLKYVSILAENKDQTTKNIKNFKEDLIKKVEELEKSLLLEVEKKYKAITDDVIPDMEKIDQLIDDVKKYLSKIIAGKYDDVKDEVVTFRLSEKQVIAANKQILDLVLKKEERVDFQCSTLFKKWLDENRLGNLNISSRSRNTVKMYNADDTERGIYSTFSYRMDKYIQPRLTDLGIHSKVSEDLGVVNTGDLCVCFVTSIPDFEKLVKDLKKGKVKNSRRFKVLVVCVVLREIVRLWNGSSLTHSSSRKLCTDNNSPYICVWSPDMERSEDIVQMIRKTVDEYSYETVLRAKRNREDNETSYLTLFNF